MLQHGDARSPKRNWLLLLALAVAGVLMLEGCRRGAPACARWLASSEAPVASDLLVAVAGGAQERLVSAADLYRQGLAPWVLVTDMDPRDDVAGKRLEALGIPRSRVLACPAPVTSTLEDAACIRALLAEHAFSSVLVVTSPYHCRRLSLILQRCLAHAPVRVTVVASRSLYWDTAAWWSHRSGWEVPAELAKLGWAWLTVPVGESVVEGGAGIPQTP